MNVRQKPGGPKARKYGWPVTLAFLGTAIVAALVGLWEFAGLLVAITFALASVQFLVWAFWPLHELPRHRVRHLRLRLFLRLHPGRGHATVFELWREWSSRASAKKDRYARP